MDIRQLRYFRTIAEQGNISRASALLNVAQPALSRHIMHLEEELGVPLFDRHARGLTLTQPGKKLIVHANFILRQVEQARYEVRAEAEAPSGRVSLAVLPTLAQILISPLIQRTARDIPSVELTVREGFSGPCRDWLLAGHIDFAVLYNVDHAKGLDLQPMLTEHFCLVGTAKAPYPAKVIDGGCPISELADIDLILPGEWNGMRRMIDKVAAARGVTIDPLFELDAFTATKDLVKNGVGYTILPASAVTKEVASKELWSLPLVEPELTRTLMLSRLTDHPVSTAGQAISEIIQEEARSLVRQGLWPAQTITQH